MLLGTLTLVMSFLNPEKIPREYPKALYTESNRVNTFVNELSLRCDDAHLGYGALFHQQPVAEEKEKQKNEFDGENPASKKKRAHALTINPTHGIK